MPGISEGNGGRSASWNPKQNGGRLLYKEWEEKFKQQNEAQIEEERKKKLDEIKASKKPMSKEELEEHARRYEELREEKRLKHLEELQRKQVTEQDLLNNPALKTRAYEKVALYDQKKKQEKQDREDARRQMIEKKEVYGKYVKQQFLPEISKTKEDERLAMIEALKHPVR